MRQLLYSPAALSDLDGVYEYIIEIWGLNQAEHYLRELHETCHNLAAANIKGCSVDYIRQGYFKNSYGSHFIFIAIQAQKIWKWCVFFTRQWISKHIWLERE